MKLSDFKTLIKTIPKKSGKAFLNHVAYFTKLYESHELNEDNDIYEFFDMLEDDAFFDKMPQDWSMRSYVSSLESLEEIVTFKDITNILEKAYDIGNLLSLIDSKRRYYNNLYKKKQRQLNKEKKLTPVQITNEVSDEALHEITVDDTIGNVIERDEKEDDNDDTTSKITSSINHHDAQSDVQSEMYSQIDDNVKNDRVVGATILEDKMSEFEDLNRSELISPITLRNDIQYVITLLNKYMVHEHDEFKRLYLELMSEHLNDAIKKCMSQ